MDFWDRYAKVYDLAEKLNGKVYKEMCAITTKLTPFHSTVLECAGGTGELAMAAAGKADYVLCTDSSARMLGVAAEKAKKLGFFNIDFEKRNIFHLNEDDETFDVVIAGNVLHLLSDPEAAVMELARVTKRGGRILLPTFMLRNSSAVSSMVLSVYKKLGFDPSTDYSPRSYVYMLRSCNCGTVKAKLIKGTIPCCYAVITKD